MKSSGCVLPVLFGVSALLIADPGTSGPAAEVLDRYLAATHAQQDRLKGVSMDVDIEANLPKLHKHGRLHALRSISKLGRITYDALRFDGDKTIKNEVIARYLSAETQARDSTASFSITPDNYKFKYKGLWEREERLVHVFHLTPRKKRVGLFKGELWVDAETYLPVRESGRFVRNPSIFLKKVEFVRDYEIRDGMALPRRIVSVVDTRIAGKAELSIEFTNFARDERAQAVGSACCESQ